MVASLVQLIVGQSGAAESCLIGKDNIAILFGIDLGREDSSEVEVQKGGNLVCLGEMSRSITTGGGSLPYSPTLSSLGRVTQSS